MPLTLTRTAVVTPFDGELDALRREYASHHCVCLRQFLEPRLFSWLHGRVVEGAWQRLVHTALDPPAVDLILEDDIAIGIMRALTHASDVFRTIQAITECDTIGSFRFRVYRMDADAGHTDTWHGDVDGNRLVTLSINLGMQPFAGGALLLREKGTGRLIHRVHNTGPGDAILFRIDPALEHFVEEVRGPVSKYALAGWFQREPRVELSGLVRP